MKHQDIKQKEPLQKYRLGTISNTKLLAGLNRFYRYLTSPSASLQTKYESSGPYGFGKEDFPMTPPGRGPYGPQGHGWQDL